MKAVGWLFFIGVLNIQVFTVVATNSDICGGIKKPERVVRLFGSNQIFIRRYWGTQTSCVASTDG